MGKGSFPGDYTTADVDKEHGYGTMLNYVWCLMPYSIQGFRILFRYRRDELIDQLKRRRGLNLQEIKEMGEYFRKHFKFV